MIGTQTADGRLLKIVFKHEQFLKPQEVDGKIKFFVDPQPIPGTRDALGRAVTRCYIVEGPRENETTVVSGESYCSVSDNFDKETGRQIALNRAIAGFDRETRGAVLAAYFNRPRGVGKPLAPETSTNNFEVAQES